MSHHKHGHLLEAIFHDPVSANIHWREVESLLHHLGAEIGPLSGARLRVKLNGHEDTLHRLQGGSTLGRQEVKHLREFLAHGRVTPSIYEQMREQMRTESDAEAHEERNPISE